MWCSDTNAEIKNESKLLEVKKLQLTKDMKGAQLTIREFSEEKVKVIMNETTTQLPKDLRKHK